MNFEGSEQAVESSDLHDPQKGSGDPSEGGLSNELTFLYSSPLRLGILGESPLAHPSHSREGISCTGAGCIIRRR